MDEIDGSDNVVLVDEPVFHLSPGTPEMWVLFGLAEAVPTLYTSGYHDNFLSTPQPSKSIPMKSALH